MRPLPIPSIIVLITTRLSAGIDKPLWGLGAAIIALILVRQFQIGWSMRTMNLVIISFCIFILALYPVMKNMPEREPVGCARIIPLQFPWEKEATPRMLAQSGANGCTPGASAYEH